MLFIACCFAACTSDSNSDAIDSGALAADSGMSAADSGADQDTGPTGNAGAGGTAADAGGTPESDGGTGSSGARATAITVGQSFACALMADTTVRCWGGTTYGSTSSGSDGSVVVTATTTAVPGLSGVTAVSAGASFVCALLDTGKVKCWGSNLNAQTGQSELMSLIPVPTEVPGVDDVAAIACGGAFACALHEAGNVTCWGANMNGTRGDGTTSSLGVPMPSAVLDVTDATSIVASTSRSVCTLSDGEVTCWGEKAKPDQSFSNRPVKVSGLSGVKDLALGISFKCAVTADDTLSCWGNPPDTEMQTLVPTPVAGLTDVRAVGASGHKLNACAILLDGSVRCWGKNELGQLGDGSKQDSLTPVEVTGITDAVAIDLGDMFACALLQDGSVRCWGNNFSGQLGNGKSTDSGAPVRVEL